MNKDIRTEIDRAKANLDKLAEALDKVATDPELRKKLASLPIETLTELGFDFDDETRKEIIEALKDETKAIEEWVGIWSASAVKSGVKSGVVTAVKSGVTSGVKTGVDTVVKKETGQGGKQEPGGPPRKKGGGKKK